MNEDPRDVLDRRLTEKVQNHECICEPELLDRISELFNERQLLIDDLKDKSDEVKRVNTQHCAKYTCRHYKGQHATDYFDCTVICDLHNDDYVSRCSCECCDDFELR